MTGTDHLFVYGTLRRHSSHEMAMWLDSRAAWIGEASMPGALYDCGPYPIAVAEPGSGLVAGDLYRLRGPRQTLDRLDDYEGCTGTNDDLYRRLVVTVRLLEDATRERHAMAYLAMSSLKGASAIVGGDWIAHIRAKEPIVRANASR